MYRGIIRYLLYLTVRRPDIVFGGYVFQNIGLSKKVSLEVFPKISEISKKNKGPGPVLSI